MLCKYEAHTAQSHLLRFQNIDQKHIASTINKAAFDHEGWAVGVAALRGYFINCDIESDYIFVTFNNGTLRNDNKVFTSAPSSVGFAATFSPRTKAFDDCAVVYTKDVYMGASARYARLRNEKHIATLGMT